MAENSVSVSTFWRGKRSEKAKKWILVCSNSDKLEDKLGTGFPIEGRRRYQLADFHMVDLEKNKIQHYSFPSLVQFVVSDSMVALDNFVYLFGVPPYGRFFNSSYFKKLQSQSPATNQHIFLGGSCLDLDQSVQKGWCPTPLPSEVNCISLLGKIYTFGSLYLEPQVLDTVDGNWKCLCSPPAKLVNCTVSNFALPDPSGNRFLVHLCGGQLSSPSLYAFFPPGLHPEDVAGTGVWKCIACDFQDWTPIALVFDGVIYFHSRKFDTVLRAFDIATGKWLKVHWVSRFDGNPDFNKIGMEFDALFLLAEGSMCLAFWSPTTTDVSCVTNIYFYKFKVVKKGESIKLRPRGTRSYELPATTGVRAFLPVTVVGFGKKRGPNSSEE